MANKTGRAKRSKERDQKHVEKIKERREKVKSLLKKMKRDCLASSKTESKSSTSKDGESSAGRVPPLSYYEETMDCYEQKFKPTHEDAHENIPKLDAVGSVCKVEIDLDAGSPSGESTISAIEDESTWSADESTDECVANGPDDDKMWYNATVVCAFPNHIKSKPGIFEAPRWLVSSSKHIASQNNEFKAAASSGCMRVDNDIDSPSRGTSSKKKIATTSKPGPTKVAPKRRACVETAQKVGRKVRVVAINRSNQSNDSIAFGSIIAQPSIARISKRSDTPLRSSRCLRSDLRKRVDGRAVVATSRRSHDSYDASVATHSSNAKDLSLQIGKKPGTDDKCGGNDAAKPLHRTSLNVSSPSKNLVAGAEDGGLPLVAASQNEGTDVSRGLVSLQSKSYSNDVMGVASRGSAAPSETLLNTTSCPTCRDRPSETPLPKKRLVDVEFLLKQIWSQRHNGGCSGTFMDMVFVKEDRSNLAGKLMFRCKMCSTLSSLNLLPNLSSIPDCSFSLHATVFADMADSTTHRLVARSSTQSKLSPQFKARLKSKAHSDSEGSAESNSLSAENGTIKAAVKDNTTKSNKKGNGRRGSEWEILEGLREGQRYETKPNVFTGYLHKKRKWPLKGWHKRYFVIDKGILVYARGPADISRGKIHGSVDIGLSVISTKSKSKRIDIDAEEFIYHLKAKRLESFTKWLEQLRQHRLYRQHLLTFGTRDSALPPCSDCDSSFQAAALPATSPDDSPTRENSLKRGLLGSAAHVGGRLAAWLIDSTPQLDNVQKDLKQISQNLIHLGKIFDQVSSLSVPPDSETTSDGLSPNVKKDRKKFGLRKKKSSKGSSVDLAHSPNDNLTPFDKTSNLTSHLSSSQTCLTSSGLANTASRPQSLPGSENLPTLPDMRSISTPDLQVREDFLVLAKDIHTSLKSALYRLQSERDRLKSACDAEANQLLNPPAPSVVATLRNALNQALIQNSELRNRLNKVHDVSDLADFSSVGPTVDGTQKQMASSLSYSSSCLSEFFDAEGDDAEEKEVERDKDMTGDNTESSSENNSLSSDDGEGSVSSENSEPPMDYAPVSSPEGMGYVTGRRTKLPAPKPSAQGLKALWNILCKNIGKDLSQISMPVALNEPLNLLQRMCEDLEYSELLDKANDLEDPYDRMVHMAAFAVSGYSNSYFRASSKPFNPLLGETYECIREDKGFRFIAEQVSHHPPISICHAESRNFTFWQDIRIKTKFWGKSLEFQPSGTINVILPKVNERYTWNKVTTCVHNLFSGQRWVDLYGELKITSSSGISCKLTFVKASYWSAKRHEVFGGVYSPDGTVVRNLFGKWNESLYCGVAPSAKCVWRPGTMPEDYELYYGFTRFAMELNELGPEVAAILPPTDTRFRPDQRLLEEGDFDGAESMKQQLEQKQRERRRLCEEESMPVHQSRWFDRLESNNGEEVWSFNHKYWECRKTPGFKDLQFDPLW